MRRVLLALLPCLLGSCALLGTFPERHPAPSSPGQSSSAATTTEGGAPLAAQAEATATGRGVTVALTLINVDRRLLTLRYAAEVNWGACGLPPYVALSREGGPAVAGPAPKGRLNCPELQFTRTLRPGETLTLRRTLPSLPPGAYTLTAWFDGEVGGKTVRVQAPAVALEVR
ncbi:hypothetical protein [Deinococcus apachensis]|uniref:hypothetical protein n=1 Tax=Deinococcus apachensis TaxID=309886 RepID=UPI0003723D0D|nr:hypothetical protein [Deinococcus apachensis]